MLASRHASIQKAETLMPILTAEDAERDIAKYELAQSRMLPRADLPMVLEQQLRDAADCKASAENFKLNALVQMHIDNGILKGPEQCILHELQMRAEGLQREAIGAVRRELQLEAAWGKHRARVRRRLRAEPPAF
jgi:hypothetical protein